jgi:hypothetical protein
MWVLMTQQRLRLHGNVCVYFVFHRGQTLSQLKWTAVLCSPTLADREAEFFDIRDKDKNIIPTIAIFFC